MNIPNTIRTYLSLGLCIDPAQLGQAQVGPLTKIKTKTKMIPKIFIFLQQIDKGKN